jgi:2-oxoglutarate ferredoxin oxidoreductase subunit gamma
MALGLIAGLSKIVTPAAMEQAIRARVPKGTEEINLRAFRKGLEIAERIQASKE